MATPRITDRWVAIGLVAVIVIGSRIISWQIAEGRHLEEDAEKRAERRKEVASEAEEAMRAQQKSCEKTENDIQLSELAILVDSPDWEIRQAATDIVFHRFANDQSCMNDLTTKIANTSSDAEERYTLEVLRELVQYRVEVPPSAARTQTQSRRPHPTAAEGLGASPPRQIDNSGAGRRNAFDWAMVDSLVGRAEDSPNSDAHAEAEEVEANVENFRELPDHGLTDPQEGSWTSWSRDTRLFPDSSRPRGAHRHREAMVIGTPGDGLEVIHPRDDELELMEHDTSAEELMEQVRGLEDQVQGLLDTLHAAEAQGAI